MYGRKKGRKENKRRKKKREESVFTKYWFKKNELDSEFPLVSACLILVTLSTIRDFNEKTW